MDALDNVPVAKEKTYLGFTHLLKWAVPTIAIIGLIVINGLYKVRNVVITFVANRCHFIGNLQRCR